MANYFPLKPGFRFRRPLLVGDLIWIVPRCISSRQQAQFAAVEADFLYTGAVDFIQQPLQTGSFNNSK